MLTITAGKREERGGEREGERSVEDTLIFYEEFSKKFPGQYRVVLWPIPVGDLANTGWGLVI